MKAPVVICDIDGTVATHGSDRGHYEYEKVGGDRPNQNVIEVVKALSGWHTIIFVTGRMEHSREITKAWLSTYLGSWTEDCSLYMRPDGDHRQDTIVKREIYNNHIVADNEVLCAIDDRNQVVSMWRDLGILCLQVADGDF
jgi:hydroxymethylpyrimidine pyrophosphatase-like HAD family hydrolase